MTGGTEIVDGGGDDLLGKLAAWVVSEGVAVGVGGGTALGGTRAHSTHQPGLIERLGILT